VHAVTLIYKGIIILENRFVPKPCVTFHNKLFYFYSEGLLTPHSTPKIEDHSLSAVRHFLFNLFGKAEAFLNS